MKQSEYIKLLKLAKTAIEEYKNWGEDELVLDKTMQIKISSVKEVKNLINNKKTDQKIKKQESNDMQINKKTNSNIPVQKNIQTKNTQQKLEDLKEQIISCKKCELGKYRLNAVCGSGDPYANIMFIGEGPGFQEDHEGKPFIGRAGDLLTKIIEAMGYKRETVYIANIVKCHPMKNPENPELKGNDRPPTMEEMQMCQPYLDEQIKLISPKVIVTLGASSTRALLKTDDVISSLRGKFTEYMGVPLMPTYHPAALLRNPKLKKDVWQDMQKVMALVNKKG